MLLDAAGRHPHLAPVMRRPSAEEEAARICRQIEADRRRAELAILRMQLEMERRARFWYAAGLGVGALLRVWANRRER